MPGPDTAGFCLECRTIFLTPPPSVVPDRSGIGVRPALTLVARCTDCEGTVIALAVARERLAGLVAAVRTGDPRRAATLERLVVSWAVAPPSPLAALAEIGPVAPQVAAVIDANKGSATERRALGTVLLLLLPSLLLASAGPDAPEKIALMLLVELVGPGAPSPVAA